jgi:hypothetical protein
MAETQMSPMFHELVDGRTDVVFELLQGGARPMRRMRTVSHWSSIAPTTETSAR